MTPDERQMLVGLFERARAAANNPRDPEAEALINDAVRQVPASPYLLAQTVLVQEQGLNAAQQQIQALTAKLQAAQASAQASAQAAPTSFLGSLGKSLFGGPEPAPAPRPLSGGAPYQAGPQASVPPSGPWSNPPQSQTGTMQAPSQGSSFLKSAFTTAAGVAGGMMLADSMRGLFSGHSGMGAQGFMGGNDLNNMGLANNAAWQNADTTQDNLQDQLDDSNAQNSQLETQLADDDATQDALQDENDDTSGGDDYSSDT